MGTIVATDADVNSSITYQIQTCELDCPFELDADSGRLELIRSLDAELDPPLYIVRVSCHDGLHACDSALVYVRLINVNDNAPVFERSTYREVVSEQVKVGTQVLCVLALDLDEVSNDRTISFSDNHHEGRLLSGLDSKVTYSLRPLDLFTLGENVSLHSPFDVNAQTGCISVRQPLDCETKALHSLQVLASDGRHFSTAVVTIAVKDENDNRPIWVLPDQLTIRSHPLTMYTLAVMENYDCNQPLLRIRAIDFDLSEPFNRVSYQIEPECGGKLQPVKSNRTDEVDRFTAAFVCLTGSADDSSGSKMSTLSQFSVPFWIDAQTGDLHCKSTLDREAQSQYRFSVAAIDGGGLKSILPLQVQVIDENDNRPLFEKKNYTIRVLESARVGSILLHLRATDRDQLTQPLQYVLHSSDSDDVMFEVDQDMLYLRSLLDYERQTEHLLRLRVYDPDGQFDEATVHVLVQNVPDERPLFVRSHQTVRWFEGQIGQCGVFAAQSEMDIGHTNRSEAINNLRYLLRGDTNEWFTLDSGSARLTIRKSIRLADFEAITGNRWKALHLSIVAIDQRDPRLTAEMQLFFYLESEPSIESRLLQLQPSANQSHANEIVVMENEPIVAGHVLWQLFPQPTVTSENYRFTLEGEDWLLLSDKVHFDSQAVRLIAKTQMYFDRELDDVFRFKLVARDLQSIVRRHHKIDLIVRVVDQNDCVAQVIPFDANQIWKQTWKTERFERALQIQIMIATLLPVPESVVSSVVDACSKPHLVAGLRAFDCDQDNNINSLLSFSMLGIESPNAFEIDEQSGAIFVCESALAKNTEHRLRVKISDLNRSDARSIVLPIQISQQPTHHFKQTEQVKASHVLHVSEAFKAGAQLLDFTVNNTRLNSVQLIAGDPQQHFELRSNRLHLRRSLDYELRRDHRLWLSLGWCESHNLACAQPSTLQLITVLINVQNENDNAPRFDSEVYEASVAEEMDAGQFLIQVSATDADEMDCAACVGASSALRTQSNTLPASATISGAELPIDLDADTFDVDFEEPELNEPKQKATLRYRLLNSDDHDSSSIHFRLDEATGELFTNTKLDREQCDKFDLKVQVCDKDELCSIARVTVKVTDRNDNPPRFTRIFAVNVTENALLGSEVLQLTCADKDLPEHAQLSYEIVAPKNAANLFDLDRQSGHMIVARPLDREQVEEVHIPVRVTDGWWQAKTTVTVRILDQNDNAPRFVCPALLSSPAGAETNGGLCDAFVACVDCVPSMTNTLGRIRATDADKGANAALRYSLVYPNLDFTLDEISGDLKISRHLTGSPLPNQSNLYLNQRILDVQACDQGRPKRCARTQMLIQLTERDASSSAATNGTLISDDQSIMLTSDLFKFQSLNFTFTIPRLSDNGTALIAGSSALHLQLFGCFDLKSGRRMTESLVQITKDTVQLTPAHEWSGTERVRCDLFRWSAPFARYSLHLIGSNDKQAPAQFVGAPNQLLIREQLGLPTGGKLPVSRELAHFRALPALKMDSPNNLRYTIEVQSIQFNARAFVYYEQRIRNGSGLDYDMYQSIISSKQSETDADEFHFLMQQILRRNTGLSSLLNPFEINRYTGQLKLNASLDHELITEYQLKVVARDTRSAPAEHTFTVHVLDVNDNVPELIWPKLHRPIRVSKSIAPNTLIGQLSGHDFDSEANGRVQFEIANEAVECLQHFRLDRDSGELRSIHLFSEDQAKIYAFKVKLKDASGNEKLYPIEIDVHREIDAASKLSTDRFEFDLYEQTAIGTVIGSILNPSFGYYNFDTTVYRLVKSMAVGIELNPDGALMVTESIDFEKLFRQAGTQARCSDRVLTLSDQLRFEKRQPENKFNDCVALKLQLVAIDRFKFSVQSADVIVNVIDVNEAPEFVAQHFDCELFRSGDSFEWLSPCFVQAYDPDNGDMIRYRLAERDETNFILNEIDGHLQLSESANAELISRDTQNITLTAIALDSSDKKSSAKLRVIVRQFQPIILPKQLRLVENSRNFKLGPLQIANSVETHKYQIKMSDNHMNTWIKLDQQGYLVPANDDVVIDRETLGDFVDIRLEVMDQRAAESPHSSEVSVRLSIEDVNDNDPTARRLQLVVNLLHDSSRLQTKERIKLLNVRPFDADKVNEFSCRSLSIERDWPEWLRLNDNCDLHLIRPLPKRIDHQFDNHSIQLSYLADDGKHKPVKCELIVRFVLTSSNPSEWQLQTNTFGLFSQSDTNFTRSLSNLSDDFIRQLIEKPLVLIQSDYVMTLRNESQVEICPQNCVDGAHCSSNFALQYDAHHSQIVHVSNDIAIVNAGFDWTVRSICSDVPAIGANACTGWIDTNSSISWRLQLQRLNTEQVCGPNARCVRNQIRLQCECIAGYRESNCSQLDPCFVMSPTALSSSLTSQSTRPVARCLNSAVCRLHQNRPVCLCRRGFNGDRCEHRNASVDVLFNGHLSSHELHTLISKGKWRENEDRSMINSHSLASLQPIDSSLHHTSSSPDCSGSSLRCNGNSRCVRLVNGSMHCECVHAHAFGKECGEFSLGVKPNGYMKLNESLHSTWNEIHVTFASQVSGRSMAETGQLLIHNGPTTLADRLDVLSLQVFPNSVLFVFGGLHYAPSRLSVSIQDHRLTDGQYYQVSVVRSRKIAHVKVFACDRSIETNQLGCDRLLNQSTLTGMQSRLEFGGQPALIAGGLQMSGDDSGWLRWPEVRGFQGCLYRVSVNGRLLHTLVREKHAVDPICQPARLLRLDDALSQPPASWRSNHLQHPNLHDAVASASHNNSSTFDCVAKCGSQALDCIETWFELRCECGLDFTASTASTSTSAGGYSAANESPARYSAVRYSSAAACSRTNLLHFSGGESQITLIPFERARRLRKLNSFSVRFRPNSFGTAAPYAPIDKDFEKSSLPVSSLTPKWQMADSLQSSEHILLLGSSKFELFINHEGVLRLQLRTPEVAVALETGLKIKLNEWNLVHLQPGVGLWLNDRHIPLHPKSVSMLDTSSLEQFTFGHRLSGCVSHLLANGELLNTPLDSLSETHSPQPQQVSNLFDLQQQHISSGCSGN